MFILEYALPIAFVLFIVVFFTGLPALKSVVLDAEPTSIKISTEGLLRGAVSEPVFYVEKGQYGKYVTDYYWSIYAGYIKPQRNS